MDIVKHTDPRVNITSIETAARVIPEGGSRITNIQVPSQGGGLNSTSTQFSFTVPDGHLLERVILLQFNLNFSTGDNAVKFKLGSEDGLRAFPLNSLIQSVQVKINNLSVSDTVNDRLKALLCFGNSVQDSEDYWSMSPTMPDQFHSYSNPPQYLNRNPLAAYSDNSTQCPRGAFRPVSGVLTGGNVVVPYPHDVSLDATQHFWQLTYQITEPIILSPLSAGLHDEEEAFVHINKVDITIVWMPLIYAWSQSAAQLALMPNMTASFVNPAPQLLVNYITPDFTFKMPQVQTLQMKTYLDFPRTDITMAANGSPAANQYTFTSDTVQVSRIPRRLFIFAKKAKSAIATTQTDTFACIQSVQITFGNDNTLLASATQQELFRIAKRNGLNKSWDQWSFYTGGPLAIELGVDIGLPPGLAPGVGGAYNLRVQAVFYNPHTSSAVFDCYMTTESDGIIQISEHNAVAYDGIFDQQEVLSASETKEHIMDVSVVGGRMSRGGSWFSDKIRSIINKVSKVAKVAAPVLAPQYSGIINPLADALIAHTGGRMKQQRARVSRSKLLLK